MEETALCGIPILKASVGLKGGLSPRRQGARVARAADLLRRHGVRTVLTAPGFLWWPVLNRAGLTAVERGNLCRAAAVPLILTVLAERGWEPGRATVALSAGRVSRPLAETAAELAGRVCRLVIDVPQGGRELAASLHREYGLPILLPGTVRPALTAAFDAGGGQGRGPVLRLYGPVPELLGAALWAEGVELPPACEPLDLLAALWERGSLPRSALRARSM